MKWQGEVHVLPMPITFCILGVREATEQEKYVSHSKTLTISQKSISHYLQFKNTGQRHKKRFFQLIVELKIFQRVKDTCKI